MAKPSEFRSYLDSTGNLPADALLGRIVLFTIADQQTKRDDLVQWFDDLGLNPALLPAEIKPVDAFKKATSEAKEEYELGNGRTAAVLCREVSSTSEYIMRQITREVRDGSRRRLAYSKAIECVFYRARAEAGKLVRGTERVRITIDPDGVGPAERDKVREIANEIETRYQRYANFLDGNKLRAVVREYLKYLNAIEIKGGVYFVHANRQKELDSLRTLVDRLAGCSMQTIPLVDLANERQMVVDAFQREASQRLEEIVRDISELRGSRKKITADAYAKIRARYDRVMDQASEYLRTLNISQDSTASAAELALDSLVTLQTEMLGAAS